MAHTKLTAAAIATGYKAAAAARRKKVAATIPSDAEEVKPVLGRIRATLSGKAIALDRQRQLFGESRINIPEFTETRKKKPF